MRFRLAAAILGLVLAVMMTGLVLAQADDDTPPTEDATPVDMVTTTPGVDQLSVSPAPMLFLQLLDPTDLDVVVPLSMDQLTIHGLTLPTAVVSIDGDLVDTDDQGNFAGATPLDEGANDVEVVASDSEGNQTSTTLFVVRGE